MVTATLKFYAIAFAAAKRKSAHALAKQDTILVLSMILIDSMSFAINYCMGPQLGTAEVYEQVKDGAAILGRLVPEVLEIMLGNHDAD